MTTLAIIHTTPATIDPLKALAAELLPSCNIVNFVDDSILPQLAYNGGNLSEVENRLVHYARFAEEVGATVVLEACSSVGELVPKMQAAVSIPIVRIDEAMAEKAVREAARIGVAATLPTTLKPTQRLLESKAKSAGKQVTITPRLVEGAFQKLMAGDRASHDAEVLAALTVLGRNHDLVVLAQASMARVLSSLPAVEQAKFISSPRSGMERVREVIS